MKISRHEKAIRAELEALEAVLAQLTDESDRIEEQREAARGHWELLDRLLNVPTETGNDEEAT